MFKAMDINKFKNYIKQFDCYIVFETKHMNYIYNSKNQLVSTFAISHKKGSKDFIKAQYIKDFINGLSKGDN